MLNTRLFSRHLAAILLLALAAPVFASAADIPKNYRLQYQQSFKSKNAFDEFMMTDRSAWTLHEYEGNTVLALHGKSDYEPPHRSPYNIALIRGITFGSFVLEVDILQSGVKGTPIAEFMEQHEDPTKAGGYNHRDHCFFFGFQDPAHYMYIHVAKTGDNNAHNVFVVNEAPRTPITDFRTLGADWGVNEWRKIRIVRDVEKSTVALYFDDMLTPIMIADDVPFEQGFIGFGSFDDIGWVDNIKIWAPDSQVNNRSFFE